MTAFSHRSLAPTGAVESGSIEAESLAAAASQLKRQGLTPLNLSEDGPTLWMRLQEPIQFFDAPRKRDVFAIFRDLARLLKAGLTLEASLKLQANMQSKESVVATLEKIRSAVRRGEGFAAALSAFPDLFPVHFVAAIHAGELSGTLQHTLEKTASALQHSLAFESRIKSALVYPAILVVMVLITLILVVTVVLPQFAPLFEGNEAQLPLLTQIVMAVGTAVVSNAGILTFGLVLLVVAMRRTLKNADIKARIHRALLRRPWLSSWVVTPEVIRFARTVGLSLQSGMTLDKALSVGINGLRVQPISVSLLKVLTSVRQGRKLSDELSTLTWFPSLPIQFVKIGERSGKTGPLLEEVAEILEEEFQSRLESAMGLLSPVVTIVMGVLIALLIGSVLMGIMSINHVVL